MDGLKLLVAAACVAIIAGAGVYLFGEYRAYRDRAEVARRVDGAREELFDFAKAKPHEIQKVRDFCSRSEAWIKSTKRDALEPLVRNCRALGYL